MEAQPPQRPLSFTQSVVFGLGNYGANVVYSFLNGAAGLYLERYPQVPTWAVGLLSQERSLAGAFVQPIVGAMSDRTRTPIGRRRPYFVPVDQRGRVGAVLAIFNMLGQVTATVAGFLLWNRSPELVFLIVAALLVVSFGITTIFIKEPDAPPRPTEKVRIDLAGYARDLWGRRELLKYVLGASLYWLGTGGVLPYLTRFGVHELGMSEGDAFTLLLPALGGTIIAAVPAGYIADRRGKKPVLVVGLLAYAILAFIASQVQTVPQALMALGVIGLANGVWTSLGIPLLVDLVPRERAAEMTGLGSAVWSLAQPVGAVFAGILIGSGDYRASFIGAAFLILASCAVIFTVRAPRPTAS
jgi:Na+/melibiose symporter-like transporter